MSSATHTTAPVWPIVGDVYRRPSGEFVLVTDPPAHVSGVGTVVPVEVLEPAGVGVATSDEIPATDWPTLVRVDDQTAGDLLTARAQAHEAAGRLWVLVDDLRAEVRELRADLLLARASVNPGVDLGEVLDAVTLLRVNQRALVARLEALEDAADRRGRSLRDKFGD